MHPGGYILGVIGARVRWFFNAFMHIAFNTPKTTYSEFLHGRIRSDKWSENSGNSTFNQFMGLLFLLLILFILYQL